MQLQSDILPYIGVSLASFVIGTLVGYFLRGLIDKSIAKTSGDRIVLIVICAAFLASVLYDIASPVYETSPLMYGLMGSVVGFFYKNKPTN